MLKAIANALAGLWRGVLGVVNWTEQLLRWPFSLIFGSGGRGYPASDYKPDVSAEQLLVQYEEARARQAAVHDLDRDGISTVLKFAAAPQRVRVDMDLSAVNAAARASLLTMDDNELKALSLASPGQIRKFLDGREHGIFGVPLARPIGGAVGMSQDEATPHERLLQHVRSRLLDRGVGREMGLVR